MLVGATAGCWLKPHFWACHSFIHTLIHSLTQLLTHSLTHSLNIYWFKSKGTEDGLFGFKSWLCCRESFNPGQVTLLNLSVPQFPHL